MGFAWITRRIWQRNGLGRDRWRHRLYVSWRCQTGWISTGGVSESLIELGLTLTRNYRGDGGGNVYIYSWFLTFVRNLLVWFGSFIWAISILTLWFSLHYDIYFLVFLDINVYKRDEHYTDVRPFAFLWALPLDTCILVKFTGLSLLRSCIWLLLRKIWTGLDSVTYRCI